MKVDWKGLAEGLRNQMFPPAHLAQIIDETHKERMDICKDCEYFRHIGSSPQCGHCGCMLNTKTRCLHCQCPINKWMPVVSKEESDEINKASNGNS